jgi:hypothetical protein
VAYLAGFERISNEVATVGENGAVVGFRKRVKNFDLIIERS